MFLILFKWEQVKLVKTVWYNQVLFKTVFIT